MFTKNNILLAVGIMALVAPDIAALAMGLQALDVPWLTWPVRGLGFLATLFARVPVIVQRVLDARKEQAEQRDAP
jgi:membrane protein implicated in regulation of membrane protease activity